MVQHAVPMKTLVQKVKEHDLYKKLMEEIKEIAIKIKKDFGDVLFIRFEGASKAQRCALWARSNVLFITCLRDGLCLVILINIVIIIATS